MTYRRRRIRIQKYQGLAEPEHNSVKASPNPDTFHRLRRRPRSTLEQPSGNARFPVTFYNLKKILLSMLEDEALERAYLAVDALDECKKEEPGLNQLLELISEMSEKSNKVKWLVTSRKETYIGNILDKSKTGA